MSLYGKAGAAATTTAPRSQEDTLRAVFKWAFLYLGVATLLHWLIWGFTFMRLIIPFATPPIQDLFNTELAVGLPTSFIYLGVTIWASRKRSVPALSILIGFAVAGLACWAYQTIGPPVKRIADQDHTVDYLLAAFQSRGTAFSWLLSLAQQAGTVIAYPVWGGLMIAQHLLTGGLCVFALMKQPRGSK